MDTCLVMKSVINGNAEKRGVKGDLDHIVSRKSWMTFREELYEASGFKAASNYYARESHIYTYIWYV